MNSIEGRTQQFTNSLQTLWHTLLDDEWVKNILKGITSIIKAASGLTDFIQQTPGRIIAIGATVTAIAYASGGFIPLFTNIINGATSLIGKIKGLPTLLKNIGISFVGTQTSMKSLTVEMFKQALASEQLSAEKEKELLVQMGLDNANIKTIITKENLSAATLSEAVANGTLTSSQAGNLAVVTGLVGQEAALSSQRALSILETNGMSTAEATETLTKLGLSSATSQLNAEMILQGVAAGTITPAMSALMMGEIGATGATTGLAGAFTALNASLGPIGWIIIGLVAAVAGGIAIFNAIHKTSKELHEDLDDINSDITGAKSEIDDLNSQLKTTQDRMAELLSMNSLSFTEEEELKNLKIQNAELERQLELQKEMLKTKQETGKNTAKDVIERDWNSDNADKTYYVDYNGEIKKDEGWGGFWNPGTNTKDALNQSIEKYKQYDNAAKAKSEVLKNWNSYDFDNLDFDTYKKLYLARNGREFEGNKSNAPTKMSKELVDYWKDDIENNLKGDYDELKDKTSSGISMVLDDMGQIIAENNLSYSMNDSDVNAFLDEYYAYQQKWSNAQGLSSKSSVIGTIFDDTASDDIKHLKEELQNVSDSSQDEATKQAMAQGIIQDALKSTNGDYERLKTTMDTVGISAEDLAGYFLEVSQGPDSSTIDGVSTIYQSGIDALKNYQKDRDAILGQDENGEDITWGNLFSEEDGKYIADQLKIASIIKGADEDTKKEFTNLVESIQNGEMDVDTAIKQFSLGGALKSIGIIKENLAANNIKVFPGLTDELDGLIDTFKELESVLDSVSDTIDLVKSAQEEYNKTGSVSIKTALQLMQSTDDWSQLLSVSDDGIITLVNGGMEQLYQAQIQQALANVTTAKTEANLQIEKLKTKKVNSEVAKNTKNTVLKVASDAAGTLSYLGSLLGSLWDAAFKDGTWDIQSWTDKAASAKGKAKSGILGEYTEEDENSETELAKKIEEYNAEEKMLKKLQNGTYEDLDEKYKGDTSDKEDKFSKAMDYWEHRIAASQSRYDQIQNEIDLIEKKGQRAGAEYYQEQIKLEKERESLLRSQEKEARAYLKTFKVGTDEWWSAAEKINSIEGALDECTSSIVDLQNAIKNIKWDNLTEVQNRVSTLHSQLSDIRDMFDDEDWFDDAGGWSETGVAELGTYIQEIEMYKNEVESINKELSNLKMSDFNSEQEYYDKYNELSEKQREYVKGIKDSENSVVSMYEAQVDAVEKYTDELTDSYQDYIDKVKEAYDAERD